MSDNLAQDHFRHGAKKALNGDAREAIKELLRAIDLGLPEDDEIAARSFLGEEYLSLSEGLPFPQDVRSQEFSRGIEQLETSVQMDIQGQHGYFLETLNRARLKRLDVSYALAAKSIEEKEGSNAAINYLQQKVSLFDRLPSNPMLTSLLNLGVFYAEVGDKPHSGECYKRILGAQVVDPADEEGYEADTRQKAAQNFRLLETEARTAQKRFTGSWKVVAVLGGLALMSLCALNVPATGVGNCRFGLLGRDPRALLVAQVQVGRAVKLSG